MSKEFFDSDLNVHKTEIGYLKQSASDFEQRLRSLETFRDKQIGFSKANYHWIAIGLVLFVQIVISLLPHLTSIIK
jgi:hypothetical protein